MRSAALWIAGTLAMWLGAVSAMVGHDFYSDAGHGTAASSSFGVAGFALIAAGALFWRKA